MNQPHTMMDGELRPPHGLMGMIETTDQWPWYWYGFVAIFLLGLLALAFYMWRRYNRGKTHHASQQQDYLEALKSLSWPSQDGEQEEFVYQLAFYLRAAMERKTQIPFTDMTFRELQKSLHENSAIGPSLPCSVEELLQFFSDAEQIKFQGKRASDDDLQRMFQQAKNWLQTLQERQQDDVPQRVMA
ncbi:MAG: DUF4381 family protein [Oligoflexus sp.]